jgi:hypothetical protein
MVCFICSLWTAVYQSLGREFGPAAEDEAICLSLLQHRMSLLSVMSGRIYDSSAYV